MSPQEVKNAASLCARTACHSWHDNMKHRDTALLYCRRCARLINDACRVPLVTPVTEQPPDPKSDGADAGKNAGSDASAAPPFADAVKLARAALADDWAPNMRAVARTLTSCVIAQAEELERLRRLTTGCPCHHTTPCSDMCSCAHPLMSAGCRRCALYGSKEQRLGAATHLARQAEELEKLRAERDEARGQRDVQIQWRSYCCSWASVGILASAMGDRLDLMFALGAIARLAARVASLEAQLAARR